MIVISEDENEEEDESNIDEERKKLDNMGVDSTWNILTSGEKKKKKPEEKPEYRGFK